MARAGIPVQLSEVAVFSEPFAASRYQNLSDDSMPFRA